MTGLADIGLGIFQGSLFRLKPAEVEPTDHVVLLASGNWPGAIYHPIDDNAAGLPDEQFWELYELLKPLYGTILCICHVGENRSGLACVMALHQRNVPVEDAISMVQSRGNHFSATQPHSFWNPGFVAQCRRLLKP